MLKEKSKAPSFSLKDQDGKTHKLSDYKDKTVILYFYPKDNTPGCTKEACAFRDEYAVFKKKGAVILGVSADSQEKHKKFTEKYSLPFTLLADTEKEVSKAYEAWGKKKFMGKEYFGISRITYLIKKGKIIKAFPKVKPAEHAKEILELI